MYYVWNNFSKKIHTYYTSWNKDFHHYLFENLLLSPSLKQKLPKLSAV